MRNHRAFAVVTGALLALALPVAAFAEHVRITGVVEQYEPEKILVIQTADQGTLTYDLTGVKCPSGIAPGMEVIVKTKVVGDDPPLVRSVKPAKRAGVVHCNRSANPFPISVSR